MLTIDYDILGIKDGEKILDVGCGEGRHTTKACEQASCTVYALDIDKTSVAKTKYLLYLMETEGKSRGRFVPLLGDATRLPFKDAYFDRVICSEVLEHLLDDRKAVGELKRVLKDDGRLAISVPTYLSETVYWKLSRDYAHQPGGHVRKYKADEITALLEEYDFCIYSRRRKHGLHFFYWLLRCLFGINNEKAMIPSLYYRFLVWDIQTKSKPIRLLERMLNPIVAKSIVLYAHKNYKDNTEG